MLEVNAQIVYQRITSSNIFISHDLSDHFELNVQCRAKLNTAKDVNDSTVLLNMNLVMNSPDEKLKVDLTADIIFELNERCDNYNEIVEQKLIPIAREALFDTFDKILVDMGHEKMQLAEKF